MRLGLVAGVVIIFAVVTVLLATVLFGSAFRYVAVTPDTTYQAFNDWGRASLYDPDNGFASETDTHARAVKVSFERPYTQGDGSSQILVFEADCDLNIDTIEY